MSRMQALVVFGLAGISLALAVEEGRPDEPAKAPRAEKPPWQRLLQGEDVRKAAEQQKQLSQHQEAGRFAEALKAAEAVADLRRKVQGADHWEAINARSTVDTLRRILSLKDEEQAAYASCFALQRQADTLESKGRYREAQPLREQSLTVLRKVLSEEHPETAQSFNNLAFNLHSQGKYAEAEPLFRKALAIRKKVLGEEHPDTAGSYNILAFNLHTQGKYGEAAPLLRKVLAIRQKVLGEEHPDTALGYHTLALNLNAQGKYDEADPFYRKALAVWQKTLGEEHLQTAIGYNTLAGNLYAQSKFVEANPLFRKALTILRKVVGEEHRETAVAYNNLALDLRAQGKYAEADPLFRQAVVIWQKVLGDDHPHTASGYVNLALNLNAQGKYVEAEPFFRKALAVWQKVLGNEHLQTAAGYDNLAVNLNSQHRYAEAEPLKRKALAIRQKALGEEHPYTVLSYNNLAANLSFQGRNAEAEPLFRKALASVQKVRGEEHPATAPRYFSLALNLQSQGKCDEAEPLFRKALAIRKKVLGEEHPDTADTYKSLALNLYNQGKYQQAEDVWLSAANAFAKARLRTAVTGLDRAARTGEASPLPALAAVLARNGKPEDAWQHFEEGLGRGTWDDLSARLRRPPDEQARQTEFVHRLHRLDRLIEKTYSSTGDTVESRNRRDDLLTQRRKTLQELDVFARHLEQTYGPAAGRVFPRREIQAELPSDTALVGWLDLAGHSGAADPNGEHWAVLLRASGGAVWVRLRGSGSEGRWTGADSRLPSELRTALQSPGGNWRPLARRLRQQRLEPLMKHLDGVRNLVVLPSTALAGVPVEVFADGYTVSYALSGTLYAHLRSQPKLSPGGLLALADPVFDRSGAAEKAAPLPRGGDDSWAALPGTRVEIAALARLFDKSSPMLLTDSEASEQRLYKLAKNEELRKFRYLHLATHGTVEDRLPLRSAVLLARDALPDPAKQLEAALPIFDGRLTAREVLEQWHLQAELVTLSACQTALGKYERGEGFIGFAQALILAGSRSVCLSLWKVDDSATALLMERFYQNLLGRRAGLDKPMGKAAALAEAKSWLRGLSREEAVRRAARLSEGVARGKGRKVQRLSPPRAKEGSDEERPYAHPYYWAAFVLIGASD